MPRNTPLGLDGQVFGKWTVLHQVERPANRSDQGTYWLCRCACGAEEAIPGSRLKAGRYGKGCRLCRGHGHTRGRNTTASYNSWRGMRERCTNPRHVAWGIYGARGIKVCERWMRSFESFLADMGERPAGATLDRIDPNGNYEPGNCRWADRHTQNMNKREAPHGGTPRITDEQVVAIRRLLAGGAKQIDIADAVGCARSHVANIATGHSR